MFSVVSSAHRHHLVIEDYLEDVLRKRVSKNNL
jgi:hypothetical protein